MILSFKSLSSPTHSKNEDNFLCDEKLKLFAVFDGMGGYIGGHNASKIAADSILKFFKNQNGKKAINRSFIKDVLIFASKKITEDGRKNLRPDQGTTATVVKIIDQKITIANVGDSRSYAVNKRNQLVRLTLDHSPLTDLIQASQISEKVAHKIDQAKSHHDLSPQGLLIFARRNVITNALGSAFNPKDINIKEVNLVDFRKLILTTDGVHDNLTDDQIKRAIKMAKNPKDIAKSLVDAAHKVSLSHPFRSKADDITAVVVVL